jgi:C-terminal processing protease CtpA/Prc
MFSSLPIYTLTGGNMGYGKILSVEAGSLAEELELVPGDKIVEVNGMKLCHRCHEAIGE